MITRAISSSATCVFMLHCIMVGGCVTSIWNELSSLHNGISNFIDSNKSQRNLSLDAKVHLQC